jgi:hypothetical protein
MNNNNNNNIIMKFSLLQIIQKAFFPNSVYVLALLCYKYYNSVLLTKMETFFYYSASKAICRNIDQVSRRPIPYPIPHLDLC